MAVLGAPYHTLSDKARAAATTAAHLAKDTALTLGRLLLAAAFVCGIYATLVCAWIVGSTPLPRDGGRVTFADLPSHWDNTPFMAFGGFVIVFFAAIAAALLIGAVIIVASAVTMLVELCRVFGRHVRLQYQGRLCRHGPLCGPANPVAV
jgi:hypothetical protein